MIIINASVETPLTAREAAKILGVCYEQVLKQAKAGLLPFFKIGNRYFFRASSLERWQLEQESVNIKKF